MSKANPKTKSVNLNKAVFKVHENLFDLSVKDRILALSKSRTSDPEFFGYDTYTLGHCSPQLLQATPNFVKWSLTIGVELCNFAGNLHGGAAATLLDYLTSTALITIAKQGYLDAGNVSRTITMSYLRPVPMGAKVTVDCEIQAAGKTTANLLGKLYNEAGKLCITCVHDKAIFSSKGREQKL